MPCHGLNAALRDTLRQGDGKREDTSRPLFACEGDCAPHEFNEFLAYDKTQTGSTVAAGMRIVHLAEGAEQEVFFVVGNTDPGIGDREGDVLLAICYAAVRRNPDLHLSLLSELDRIAGQVRQDLI